MQIKKHSNTQKFILCEGVAATCEGGFWPQSWGPEDETSSPGGISGQDLNFNLPFSPDDSVEDIGLHLSEILANGIKKTRNLLDPVQLEMTAYNIKKSHRVFLFGKGDSRISLENFKNKMIKLNEYFIIGDEYQNNFYTVGNILRFIFC